jgi:hypothetical protein
MPATGFECLGDLVGLVIAVKELEFATVEGLRADRDAIDATRGQGFGDGIIDRGRIGLDGELVGRAKFQQVASSRRSCSGGRVVGVPPPIKMVFGWKVTCSVRRRSSAMRASTRRGTASWF